MNQSLLYILLFFFFISHSKSETLKINEIVASSMKNYFDEDHDDSDWIEIFNPSDSTINLKDYKIYDKDKINKAWVFPDVSIQPKGFLRVFASDKNRVSSDKYHVSYTSNTSLSYAQEDDCRFQYTQLNGNFEISIRINSIYSKDFWAFSGLMIRESLESSAKQVGIYLNPFDILYETYRSTFGEKSNLIESIKYDVPYVWFKIKRENDSITFYNKFDGVNWKILNSIELSLQDTLLVGIATALGNQANDNFKRTCYSDFEINNLPFDFDSLKVSDFISNELNYSQKSQELHTNFKLSISGENVFLWDNAGKVLDNVQFSQQISNISYGRYPDGSDNFVLLKEITPAAPNSMYYDGVANKVTISHNSGWYDDAIAVTLSTENEKDSIYYTLNGDDPSLKSTLYTGESIKIDSNLSLKASVIKYNYLNNFVECRSYFINQEFRLPTIAVTSAGASIWGDDNGSLKNNPEIPVNFDFYERKGIASYSSGSGAKMHGQTTFSSIPQKSLRFYSRDLYGKSEFDYKFWNNQKNNITDKFVIKNGGQDWFYTFLRESFVSSFIDELNFTLLMEARPIEAYINGKYSGIYVLRNRFDEDYLAERFDIDDETIHYIEDEAFIEQGSAKDYLDMIEAMKPLDMSIDSVFNLASSKLDLNNFTEYTIYRFYTSIYDWPGYNHKIWNSPEIDDKWRFVLHDFELSLGLPNSEANTNMFVKVDTTNTFYSTIFRKLLENKTFSNNLANTFADVLNTNLLKENTTKKLDSLASILSIAVKSQQKRWEGSLANWEDNVDVFRGYLQDRPEIMFSNINDKFQLGGISRVNISRNIDSSATFKLNSLTIQDSSWSGRYFKNLAIKIKCEPKAGFVFVTWMGDTISTNPELEILPGDSLNLIAVLIDEKYVSVEDFTNSIKVFPNPSNQKINIQLLKNIEFGNNNISIIDAFGKVQLEVSELNLFKNDDTIEINIEKLTPGVYFIKIGNITEKFIKI